MSNLLDALNKNPKKEEMQNIETIHRPPAIENIIQKYKKPSLNDVMDKFNQPQEQIFPSYDNSNSNSFFNKKMQVVETQKIKNVHILASCKENQKSLESIVTYNSENFSLIKPKIYKKIHTTANDYNNTIIVGAFTFNLIKLIKENNLINITSWFSLENKEIWKKLEEIINQKITIIK